MFADAWGVDLEGPDEVVQRVLAPYGDIRIRKHRETPPGRDRDDRTDPDYIATAYHHWRRLLHQWHAGRQWQGEPDRTDPGVLRGSPRDLRVLAFNDKLRKHAMHFAAMVGLFGTIGGFMPLVRQYNKTGSFDPTKPSAVAGELMILICVVFVGLCVKSFITRGRRAGEGSRSRVDRQTSGC